MPSSFRRSLPIAGAAVLMMVALAERPASAAPHVRPLNAEARELLEELTAHSPTVRHLLDLLEASDVIVYVRHHMFADPMLDGRTGLVRSTAPTRLLIVELPCARARMNQLVALGHELQHAVEIAEAPDVVDVPSITAYYRRIGVRAGSAPNAEMFETDAAREISVQVRKELGTSARSTNDRH
jgi:hypothetical protein